MLNQEQRKSIEDSLVDFVVRIATNKMASPEELAALPEIAKLVIAL